MLHIKYISEDFVIYQTTRQRDAASESSMNI